jgi:DNA processing protein
VDAWRYWVGFSAVKGIGPARLRTLIEYFGDVSAAWHASPAALQAAKLDARTVENLIAARQSVDLDSPLRLLERHHAHLITFRDPDYPPLLLQIPDPPLALYVRGAFSPADARSIAIVGARKATEYGRLMVDRLVGPLVEAGFTIVSGLAPGIDAAAHTAALRAGGRTIAVLPCGIDRVFPADHSALAARIAAGGAVITEFAPGTPAERYNFMPRNRIISGLSLGVVVVEAGEKSGALITADCALEQGREVFAVPGHALWPSSVGTHNLIRAGARLTTSAADIFEELGINTGGSRTPAASYQPESAEEAAVLQVLGQGGPQHIDEICAQSRLPAMVVSGVLTILELKGVVTAAGAMRYALA